MKRSLEIRLKTSRHLAALNAANVLENAGVAIAEARDDFIQVRKTTPTEIRRILRANKIAFVSIRDGFSR
jgi:hypothetical protein